MLRFVTRSHPERDAKQQATQRSTAKVGPSAESPALTPEGAVDGVPLFGRELAVLSIGLALFSAVGCGGDEGNGENDSNSDISLGNSGTGSTSGDSGQGDGGLDGCSEFSNQGCSGVTYEGENVPLDIYVMFDLSCSMSCTVEQEECCRIRDDVAPESQWRIEPVREAMRYFLEDPQSAGIGVGLGFFGDHDIADPNNRQVCTVASHTNAEVPIAPLPDSAPELISTLEAGEPQGGTPTHLAIEGACSYSDGWKQQNPTHKVVVLLVTDGIPEYSCYADIEQAVQSAEECYDGGAGRDIYVLGVAANNNNSLEQLNDIAESGGTEQAYLTDSGDVAGSVLAALNAIRADATIPCTINIPEPSDGATIDYNRVNVGICDAAGETVHTYFVPDPADCDSGAWYYDDVGGEQVVQLCDQTCETVGVSGSALSLSVGCETVVAPVQ